MRVKPTLTVEEALERARVPEWKPAYLPGPPPSIWQQLTSAICRAWQAIVRATVLPATSAE